VLNNHVDPQTNLWGHCQRLRKYGGWLAGKM